MARKSDADSERTVNAIVEAAIELIAADTSRGAVPSLRSVARAANLSIGTIQYYFNTKEELFEACLDGYYGRLSGLSARLASAAAEAADSRQFVEGAVLALYRWAGTERAFIALRLGMNTARGELHPRRQQEFMGAFLRQAAEHLRPHVEVDLVETQLAIQAIATLVSRFALMNDAEVESLTGVSAEEGRSQIEAFVVRAGRRLVRPGDG